MRSARILAHPAPPCGRCDQYHAGQICPRALSVCPYCGLRGHIEVECQRKLGDELAMGNAETEENEAPEGGQAQSAVDPVGDALVAPGSPEYMPASYSRSVSLEYMPASPPWSQAVSPPEYTPVFSSPSDAETIQESEHLSQLLHS